MSEGTPEGFPINTLVTQRALTALNMKSPEKFQNVLAALYHALWVENKPINKPEVVIPIMAQVLKISEDEAKALFAKGNAPEVKKSLIARTDVAFDDGAFGLPWYIGTLGCFSSSTLRQD
jgi:2-hydroxychromene-2-carboxylate isomerase